MNNAINRLKNSINLKRYNYFFEQKNIDPPNPTLFSLSISNQIYPLVKNDKNNLAWNLYQDQSPNEDCFSLELFFYFRESPIDEIEGLVTIYFSVLLVDSDYESKDRFYGISIWSEKTNEFYTFLLYGFAPGTIIVLDNNFLVYLTNFLTR